MMEPSEELLCPISLELLDDPVSTPCCGHALSRSFLRAHLAREGFCPLCRTDIHGEHSGFDVDVVPRNRTVASLVDAHRVRQAQAIEMPKRTEVVAPIWSCSLKPCVTQSGRNIPVGQLKINVEWPSYRGDVCLFLPVIDKSGSMGGEPFDQVKTALMHMLHQTLHHRNVFTSIIPYDSSASLVKVPRDGGAETERWRGVQRQIREMRAGGGTSFANAFAKIKEVLFGDTSGSKVQRQEFAPGTADFEEQRRLGRQGLLVQGAPAFVKNVVIVFMTDGQDNRSGANEKGRAHLVDSLRDILAEWTREVTVHTVGFSRSHDFEFLDALRKVGRREGLFRYADPSDGSDSLCSKLSELTDAIVASTCLPIQIERMPFAVWNRGQTQGKLMRSMPMLEGCGSLQVFVEMDEVCNKDGEDLFVSVHVPLDEDGATVTQCLAVEKMPLGRGLISTASATGLGEWEKHLVDEITTEAFSLAVSQKSREREQDLACKLHCVFLLQRAKCLESHLKDPHYNTVSDRLSACVAQISAMLSGSGVNVARLGDLQVTKTEGKGTQSQAAAVFEVQPRCSTLEPRLEPKSKPRCRAGRGPIFQNREGLSDLHNAVLAGKLENIRELMACDASRLDSAGDSALSVAAAIGRCNAISVLLDDSLCRLATLHQANANGQTPLEVAALRGHWRSVELLIEAGADLQSARAQPLVEELLHRGFFNTAGRLVAAGFGSITNHVLRSRVPASTLAWVMMKNAESELVASDHGSNDEFVKRGMVYLQRAVENGMLDMVQKLLHKGIIPPTIMELESLVSVCCSLDKTTCGAHIAELLLGNSSSTSVQDARLGKQVHTAAGAGRSQLLEVLLRRPNTDCNWRDGDGCTALWMACQGRHMDCIVSLLNASADHSMANYDGVTPLMKACMKNHCAAVGALFAANAAVLSVDGGNDSAILVCCRVDRPEILEMLLGRCMRSHGKFVLQAELIRIGAVNVACAWGHAACVKVLLAHDADIEAKSLQSDPIMPDATALHLAVHHGHVQVITTLIEASATIDARDFNHSTPLHIAVQKEHVLIVRLLRTLGADIGAKDMSGRLPVSYCEDGSSAAAIRAELVDPALDLLLLAARQSDEASCSSLGFAGLLGYLSVRQCVDVHSGDFWTPLMEAVVCGNVAFAHALARRGADVHRGDARGMSAMFWAHALFGRDVAVSLATAAQHFDSQTVSEQSSVVKCKDGELHVSTEAFMWMQDNFPLTAAGAVSRATLAVTLRAQGMDVSESEGECSRRQPEAAQCALLNDIESAALECLHAASQMSVGDALILEVNFDNHRQPYDVASDHFYAPEALLSVRRARMASCSSPKQISRGLPNLSTAIFHQHGVCEVVDFFRKMPRDQQVSQDQLSLARLEAIRLVASGVKLRLQHVFLLNVFCADTTLLNFTNAALHSGEVTDILASFISTLHDALRQLPMMKTDMTVFRLIPGNFEPETYMVGSILHWSGFTIGFSNQSAVFGNDAAQNVCSKTSSKNVLLRINARTGRVLSEFSTGLNCHEVVFTPGTCFKVTGRLASDKSAWSLEGCQVDIVDLEEVTLDGDHVVDCEDIME